MNRILQWVGGAAWFVLVFWATLWLTFPSAGVSAFVTRVVEERTGGAWRVTMASVRPWWLGLAGSGVEVARLEGAELMPVALVDDLGVRLSPWALLRKSRQFALEAAFGDGTVSAQVSAADDEGQLKVRKVWVAVDDLPTDVITGLLRSKDGGGLELSGSVDAEVDLKVNEGLEKAGGTVTVHGNDLRIVNLSAPKLGVPELAIDAGVRDLDLRMSGEDGKLEISRGVLDSDLAHVEVGGTFTLGDKFDRSRVELSAEVEVLDWGGTELEKYKPMVDGYVSGAKCDDGKLRYEADATISRLGFNDFRPQPCRGSVRPPSRTTTPREPEPAGLPATPPATPPAAGEAPPPAAPLEGAPPVADEPPPLGELGYDEGEEGDERGGEGEEGDAPLEVDDGEL